MPRRFLVSLGVGAVITALSVGLIEVGGWGRCGPESALSYVGYLLFVPVLTMADPLIGHMSDPVLYLLAILVWSAVAFGLASAVAWVRGRVHQDGQTR